MIDVCDIQVMKPMLAAHGFHFSKAKGQNFLIAPWVPQSIAEQAGVDETAGVLEIGPGSCVSAPGRSARWRWTSA